MLVFFILVNLISNAIESDLGLIIDASFILHYKRNLISMDNCTIYNKDSFYFKGKPRYIKDIIDSNKTNDLNKYEVVYIPETKYLQNVNLFPKSTIFLYYTYYRFTFNESYKDYCFINVNHEISSYNLCFITIGKIIYDEMDFILMTFLILFMTHVCLMYLLLFKILGKKLIFSVYQFFFRVDARLLLLIICSYFTCLFTYLLYCYHQSFIFIYLFSFVNRFKILDNKYLFFGDKNTIIFFIFNSLVIIFVEYIVYFIPSINKFYLLAIKDVLLYIVLLIKIIISFKSKLILLFRQMQYAVRKKLKFSAISFQVKITIYIKMFLFGAIYSITFIVLPFIIILLSLDDYIDIFYYYFYFKAILEILLGQMIVFLFYLIKDYSLNYNPINLEFDSNNELLYLNMDNKKENNYNISNLSKTTLNEKNFKKLFVIFLNPFPKKI